MTARALPRLLALAAFGLALAGPAGAAEDGAATLAAKCAGCHERTAGGGLARVSEQRKSPEGWLMTLRRMEQWHGVVMTDAEEKLLLKHLSDTLGLAPSETAPYRYVLERQPGRVEAPDDAELAAFCGRCHSYARMALQRRDAHEWRKLVHMHLGQWPTLEYQALARDREWFRLADGEIARKLGEKWPFQSAAWDDWRKRGPVDLSGNWRVAGERPGKGQYAGWMTVRRTAADEYDVSYEMAYADGAKVAGTGAAVVYTGYEWRGTLTIDGKAVRQVFAVAADGRSLGGRWFLDGEDAVGGELRAVRDGQKAILAVQPPFLKAGETTRVTIIGSGMAGVPNLGGATVVRALSTTLDTVVVEARADKAGPYTVSVGGLSGPGVVAYDRIDSVRVEPPLAISRTGGGGGPIAPVPAQFSAVGYLNGPDGKPGTDDDLRIGALPAKWSVEDFDEAAVEAKDALFAGTIDLQGLFRPAPAGMNAERGPLLNNYGNLKVKAVVGDGAAAVEGTGHLFVVPQRWNNPPIL